MRNDHRISRHLNMWTSLDGTVWGLRRCDLVGGIMALEVGLERVLRYMLSSLLPACG